MDEHVGNFDGSSMQDAIRKFANRRFADRGYNVGGKVATDVFRGTSMRHTYLLTCFHIDFFEKMHFYSFWFDFLESIVRVQQYPVRAYQYTNVLSGDVCNM